MAARATPLLDPTCQAGHIDQLAPHDQIGDVEAARTTPRVLDTHVITALGAGAGVRR